MSNHSNLLTRIEKIKAAVIQMDINGKAMAEKLRKRDEPLVQKVKRLEEQMRGFESLMLAKEHVLVSLSKELDTYRDKDKTPKE